MTHFRLVMISHSICFFPIKQAGAFVFHFSCNLSMIIAVCGTLDIPPFGLLQHVGCESSLSLILLIVFDFFFRKGEAEFMYDVLLSGSNNEIDV